MNITWRERVSEMAPELRQFECDSKWTAQKKHGFRVQKKQFSRSTANYNVAGRHSHMPAKLCW